ncbi:MAG: methyltransferase [Nitratireductor sp.]|nr:methyltransferase [Nitratireductor sp.]
MNVVADIGRARQAAGALKVSLDEFYRGVFQANQPLDTGHRSGSDALLIAASLPEGAAGRLADLGSGAGVAGLAAAASNPELDVTLIEKNPQMASLARGNLRLRPNLKFAGRTAVLEADVTLSGAKREAAGLKENSFDFAIMNPPYNHDAQRPSPDLMRSQAHVMGLFGLDAWMRTAVAILKPGGMLAMIYRTEKIGEVYACCQGRFGALAIVPVHSKADECARRILLRMVKGSRAPLNIMPGIVMHEADGKPTELAARLMNGEARVCFE